MVVRVWWYIVFVVLLGGCKDSPTEPAHTDEPFSVRIVTTMPGNTEGSPGVEYSFRAVHPAIPGNIQYLWDFDTTRITSQTPSVQFTFTTIGWYGVTVSIRRDSSNIGTAFLLVNVRGTPPQIPMMLIPAGTYLRGSTRGNFTEQPVVSVRISRPFYMSVTEITQAQWEQIMGTSPAYHQGASLPVESISWMDAVDFCNRLSIRSGFRPCYIIRGDTVQCDWTANGYRLPTEAEWEYAARAGTTTDVYSGQLGNPYASCLGSDTLDPALDLIAWYCLNSGMQPHPVGQKVPNAWGLYDMIGNVAEFVWDWDSGSSYAPGDTLDPQGPASGALRRARGGNYYTGARDNRAAARGISLAPTRTSFGIGIRLVRSALQ